MPIYEFQCEECYQVVEHTLPMEQRHQKQTCERCGKTLTRRLFAPHVAPIAGIPNKIGREIEG